MTLMATPRELALNNLRRKVGTAFLTDDDPRRTLLGLTTGCIAADFVTGIGGFPIGRASEVFGWESSGKTTLCVAACAAAQRAGKYPIYLDMERGLDLTHAERMGFDVNDDKRGLYVSPDSFEEAARVVFDMTPHSDLIIVDSVPALTPKSVLDADIEDIGAIANQARSLAAFLQRIVKHIEEHQTALVLVNQMRQNIQTRPVWGARPPEEKTAGGAALRFYSSLRLELSQLKKNFVTRSTEDLFTGKTVEVPVASQHSIKAFKNKVGTPYRDARFVIRFDHSTGIYGIDNLQTLVEMATNSGVVETKGGGYYNFSSDKGTPEEVVFTARSADGLYHHLSEHPDHLAAVRKKLAAEGILPLT
jgi:recombination protein RecA